MNDSCVDITNIYYKHFIIAFVYLTNNKHKLIKVVYFDLCIDINIEHILDLDDHSKIE